MDTPEPTAPDTAVTWWYYADASNKTTGPVTLEQLREMLARGTITPSTYVSEPGVDNWRRLSLVVPEAALPSPPPLPSADVRPPSAAVFPDHPRLENLRISVRDIWHLATERWRAFAEVNPAPNSRPWYHRTATIVASAAFCFPASVALIWTAKRFQPRAQIVLTALCVFVIPFFLISMRASSTPPRTIAGTSEHQGDGMGSGANSGGKKLGKRELDVALREVEQLSAELDRLLDVVQSGRPITAQTKGEIELWKGDVAFVKKEFSGYAVDGWTASGDLYQAVCEMENAWWTLVKTAQGKDMSASHATSLKFIREDIQNAKTRIAEGKY